MALVLKDRVKETTTTTGTGAIALGGAVDNFQAFSAVLSDTDTTYYAVIDVTNSDFEVGLGTYASGGNTLARTTVLESSNGGSAVNFSAGTKNVFIAYPAEKSVYQDASGGVTFDNGITEEYTAVTSTSNAATCNMQDGTNFSHTLTENTTFTFSNPAASGKVSAFTLKIVQDASASGYTVTWPTSVDWPNATAPTLTSTASAVDIFVFMTHDGGTTWYGFTAGQALG